MAMKVEEDIVPPKKNTFLDIYARNRWFNPK
jgi:hypothetical protein